MMLGDCARALSHLTIIFVVNNEMNFMEIPSDGCSYTSFLLCNSLFKGWVPLILILLLFGSLMKVRKICEILLNFESIKNI